MMELGRQLQEMKHSRASIRPQIFTVHEHEEFLTLNWTHA